MDHQKDKNQAAQATDNNGEEPQVFAIQRDGSGWTLGRREFLKGSVAAAAGAMVNVGDAEAEPAPDDDTILAHKEAVDALAISPDGQLLASGSRDDTIKLWTLPEGALLKTLEGHENNVKALAISPDGTLLASGSDDSTIRLWAMPEGTLLKTIQEHEGGVYSLAISPDGTLLASGNSDNTIRLWTLPDGTLLKTIHGLWDDLDDAQAIPKETLDAYQVEADDLVRIRNEKRISELQVNALAFSPDGRVLVSGRGRLWSLPEGVHLKTFSRHSNDRHWQNANALAISPDGRTLAVGTENSTVRLWLLPFWFPEAGSLSGFLHGHSGRVNALAFSPDGQVLASGSKDSSIKLWTLPEGTLLKTLGDHEADVNALALSPDGTLLVSGSSDKTIRLWTLPEGEYQRSLLDLKVSSEKVRGVKYRARNAQGQTVSYTLPCGSPIPPGAVCTCNCVPGSVAVPRPQPRTRTRTSHYWYPN